MTKHTPKSTTPKVLPVQGATSATESTQQQDENENVHEHGSRLRDIVAKSCNPRRCDISAVPLESLIPFLTDQDISRFCKASIAISEAMKPLYLRGVFPQSNLIVEFMQLVQKTYSCSLRLPPPGLTPWRFHDIVFNLEECCRCSRPVRVTNLPSPFITHLALCFQFCDLCSKINWRKNRKSMYTEEVFQPVESTKAKRLLKDLQISDAFKVRSTTPGLLTRSEGPVAYCKFGIDWILRDIPSLANNAIKMSQDAVNYHFSEAASTAVLQAKESLKSALSLPELPVWCDNHFLVEQVRQGKLELQKDADYVIQAFNKSSALYTWTQMVFAGLHRQTNEFVNVETLLDAAMRDDIEKVKDEFVTKAQHYSDMLYGLEAWRELPNLSLLRVLENFYVQDIPDVIFKNLPDVGARAQWLQDHSAEFDIPSDLLKYFVRAAHSDIMHKELCLRDATWRWRGLKGVLGEEDQKFAMEDYQTQRWIFSLNPVAQSRKEVVRALKIGRSLRKEFPKLNKLADMEFYNWERAQQVLGQARYQRKLNVWKSKLLNEMSPEIRVFMNNVRMPKRNFWGVKTYMMRFEETLSKSDAIDVIDAAGQGYAELQTFLRAVPDTERPFVDHLVDHFVTGTKLKLTRKETVHEFRRDYSKYVRDRQYPKSSSPDLLQEIINEVYPDEFQRYCERSRIQYRCIDLESHLDNIRTLLHNQSEVVKSRLRKSAIYFMDNRFERCVGRGYRGFSESMQQVLRIAKWEDQSAPVPVWVSPECLQIVLRLLVTEPWHAMNYLERKEKIYIELEASGRRMSMIDSRFQVNSPEKAKDWFKAHERARDVFLSQVSIEESKRESSSPSNFKVLPEKCIKRLQHIAKTHWRGYFEALDELRIDREAVLAIDRYLQLGLTNGKLQSLTPEIQQLILDGNVRLAARQVANFSEPSSERHRDNWHSYSPFGRYWRK